MGDAAPRSSANRSQQTGLAAWLPGVGQRLREFGGKAALTGLLALVVGLGTFTEALDGVITRVELRCHQFGPCAPLPPPYLVGALTNVRLGAANVPQLAAWQERNLATPPGLTAQDAKWPGRFITYLHGLANAVCLVRWTLLDAVTDERVVDDRYGWKTVHAIAYPDSNWTAQAVDQDINVGTLWVPYVAAGTFVVEVELLDPHGIPLDVEPTPPFTVAADDLPR
jgi:hypothetical protein